MWQVEIRLRGVGQLPEALMTMRRWLAQCGYRPKSFLYDIVERDRLVRVTFDRGNEADLFAARFSGRVKQLLSP
jgi:hypothetical protein